MKLIRRFPALQFVLVFLAAAALSGLVWRLSAYDFYSDLNAPDSLGNCASCHEAGPGGFIGRGPLHQAHTVSATSNCKLCHTSTGDVPRLGSSGEVGGVGCIGCHGQPLATLVSSGAGLRLHHANANVPADPNGLKCVSCHASDPIPPPESTVPVYYARTDVVQKTPCNTDGKEDFWNRATGQPDGFGLDNDGDLLRDALEDPDCGASACRDGDRDGYGDPGDPSCPNGAARDCDDSRSDVFPGAVEAFDSRDNNCNGEVDEIENVGFSGTQQLTWKEQPPSGQLYDVIRSDSPQFPATSALSICLALATPQTLVDDPATVPARTVFYYLVRNTLVADYGKTSNGALRLYTLCP